MTVASPPTQADSLLPSKVTCNASNHNSNRLLHTSHLLSQQIFTTAPTGGIAASISEEQTKAQRSEAPYTGQWLSQDSTLGLSDSEYDTL